MTLYCADVMEKLDPSYQRDGFCLPSICCGSCHEDQDWGYPLMDKEVDGEEVEVCCGIWRALDEKRETEC